MTDLAIQTQNLSVAYDAHNALTDVSLAIPRGSVVGLLGKNGAGKSTLIKALLGFIKPTNGSSSLLGQDSLLLSADTKARLGIALQNPTFYTWLTGAQLIQYTANFYSNWNASLTDRLIKQWDVPIDKPISACSPGEVQKLACILALSHNADLFILDEPAASLDPVARRQLLVELVEIASGENKTILFSTHIVSDLERIANQVIFIERGKIRLDMPLDALKDSVKRLRFPSPPDTHPITDPHLTNIRRSPTTTLALATGYSHFLKESLQRQFGAPIDVEDLSLEEIFLELNHE